MRDVPCSSTSDGQYQETIGDINLSSSQTRRRNDAMVAQDETSILSDSSLMRRESHDQNKVDEEASASAGRIRSRYLHRLGIVDQRGAGNAAPNAPWRRKVVQPISILRQKPTTTMSDPTLTPPLSPNSSTSSTSSSSSSCSVSFARNIVSGTKTIPCRADYPRDVRNTLWIRGEEYHAMVQRNMIEFWAEGCDPDRVLEEDQFIPSRHRLIHPAHLLLVEY